MGSMTKTVFESWKSRVIAVRVKTCCLLAPLRVGLMIIGYLNMLSSTVLVIGTATDGLLPLIHYVHFALFEDTSKFIAVMGPTCELAASVLLLCGIHRNDVTLLWVYMIYALVAIVISFLVYAIVISAISVLYIAGIMFSTLYQIYIIVLVRSLIVTITRKDSDAELAKVANEVETTTVVIEELKAIEPATKDVAVETDDTKLLAIEEGPREVDDKKPEHTRNWRGNITTATLNVPARPLYTYRESSLSRLNTKPGNETVINRDDAIPSTSTEPQVVDGKVDNTAINDKNGANQEIEKDKEEKGDGTDKGPETKSKKDSKKRGGGCCSKQTDD